MENRRLQKNASLSVCCGLGRGSSQPLGLWDVDQMHLPKSQQSPNRGRLTVPAVRASRSVQTLRAWSLCAVPPSCGDPCALLGSLSALLEGFPCAGKTPGAFSPGGERRQGPQGSFLAELTLHQTGAAAESHLSFKNECHSFLIPRRQPWLLIRTLGFHVTLRRQVKRSPSQKKPRLKDASQPLIPTLAPCKSSISWYATAAPKSARCGRREPALPSPMHGFARVFRES